MNRTAGFERKQICLPKERPEFTGNSEMDLMVAAMRALEHREGERRGWDQKPYLYVLYMLSHDAMEVRIVPEKRWFHLTEGNPVDAIIRQAAAAAYLALTEQNVVPAKPLAFADSPDGLAGVGLMVESWGVAMEDLTEEERRRIDWGERLIQHTPKRVEMRQLFAADINANGYSITRMRGQKDPTVTVQTIQGEILAGVDGDRFKQKLTGDDADDDAGEQSPQKKDGIRFEGRLVRAITGLATAARLGTWPLDPHKYAGTSIPDMSGYRPDLFRQQDHKFTL